MIVSMCVFFFVQNAKLCRLLPLPTDPEKKKLHEGKRMLRTIGLVLGALSAGIAVAILLPAGVASVLGRELPAALALREEALVNVCSSAAMFLIACFFR
jgi:hypothetical protein